MEQLLVRLAQGSISIEEVMLRLAAVQQFQSHGDVARQGSAIAQTAEATIDIGRRARCGFGEVIYGVGKSKELIAEIAAKQLQANQPVLITRIDEDAAVWLQTQFQHTRYQSRARTLRIDSKSVECVELDSSQTANTPHVAVVTAGSTDAPVADEAVETLAWMEVPWVRFSDIGVAGPQRLVMAVPRLRQASAVIVIAGMEGALPPSVAGHLSVPVVAVPTSIGYGANLGGLTTMLGMLCSCAPNVAVVNIDAGFKGGYFAGMIVRQLEDIQKGG